MTAAQLSRLGFIPDRVPFAVRTALSACLALLVAWMIGLEHPQWSAMTVFASAQPTRMQLLEKSFFRAAGTLVGTVLGVLLVLVSGGEPLVLVLGLSAWIGFCVLGGNVLRGFTSYGLLLAGFSATMVALLDTAHPDRVLALGGDRLLTVLTGVLTTALVGLLFAPRQAEHGVVTRLRELSASAFDLFAAGDAATDDERRRRCRTLLRELAVIEDGLDQHGAGSIRARRSVRSLRAIVWSLVDILVWLRHGAVGSVDPQARRCFAEVAGKLHSGGVTPDVYRMLDEAAGCVSDRPTLHAAITRSAQAFRGRIGIADDDRESSGEEGPKIILHRDWIGARQASLRALGVMLLLGFLWLSTGWHAGPLLLLGASVMASLFSTWENPALIMRYVLAGQTAGAVAALACHWLVWPYATSDLQMVLMLMPFMLVGILLFSHRRTISGSIDYCMALLLLSQPALPLARSFGESIGRAAAVIAGPAIALVAFHYAFPADASRRLGTLVRMMLRDLKDIARAADAQERAQAWHARMSHRLLRAVSLADRAGRGGETTAEGCVTAFALGSLIFRLKRMQHAAGLSPGLSRAVDVALRRFETIDRRPERVLAALDRLATRHSAEGLRDDGAIRSARILLRANMNFFRAGHAV